MARDKSPVQMVFEDVVRQSVTSVLKPLRFRKSALNYYRRNKDVVQVVNLQSSQGSNWNEKIFYVNVGLAFDAVCHLTNAEVLEKPKEHECSDRGTRDRLECLLDDVPDCWTLCIDDDPQNVAQRLRTAVEQLTVDLQAISCLESYREHRWFNRFRPKQENAQILYLLGDEDAAWKEVEDLCRLFADRQSINRPQWWIEELGLTKLAARTAG